ncbi:MAG: hypothetical protein ACYDER_13375 [Ktedonobacteraceae bacterium]
MKIQKKFFVACIPLVLLALFISACSSTGTSGSSSNLTALQVLQNSATAMQKLKSSHIDFSLTGSANASATATPTSSTSPSSASFSVKGNGDEALPSQESLHITTMQGTNLAEIVLGSKVYIQNTKGQWYVLDKSSLQGMTGNPFSGIDISNINDIIALAQHAQITDHGDQNLNGQSLRHITIALDKQGLQQLLTQNGQLASVIGQQAVNTIINGTQGFNSTLDIWIDETQFYVHRTELKLNVSANLSAATATTGGNVPANVSTTIDSIVDLSKFNETVNITAPANAIPTTNPVSIFTGQ